MFAFLIIVVLFVGGLFFYSEHRLSKSIHEKRGAGQAPEAPRKDDTVSPPSSGTNQS